MARPLLVTVSWGSGRSRHIHRPGGAQPPGDTATAMDFWYERVLRELFDIDDEASELRRLAERASPPAPAQDAHEEQDQHGGADHEPDRSLG